MSKEMMIEAYELLLEEFGRIPTKKEIDDKIEDLQSSEIDQAMDRLEEEQ